MTNSHKPEHLDGVLLYALHVLPASETTAVEGQLSECSGCRDEYEKLAPIVASFAAWPTDVLRPSPSLWNQLSQRIAQESGADPFLQASPSATRPEWEEVARGISVKILATDLEKNRVSMLVRLAPLTEYPPHQHAGIEELHLLHGELVVDEKTLHPGDYYRGYPGSIDHRVWSETGCTCVLVTFTNDTLL